MDTLAPEVLAVAAHELGHAVAARAAGVRVLDVTVNARTLTGLTRRDLPRNFDDLATPEQLAAVIVGDLAGYEAETLWCRKHGGRPDRACATTDLRQFRRLRRKADISESAARSQARRILRAHWPEIERLAPKLATRGRLSF